MVFFCAIITIISTLFMPDRLLVALLLEIPLNLAGSFMIICITRLYLMTQRESEFEK